MRWLLSEKTGFLHFITKFVWLFGDSFDCLEQVQLG